MVYVTDKRVKVIVGAVLVDVTLVTPLHLVIGVGVLDMRSEGLEGSEGWGFKLTWC